ncbi:B box and SPRY domain-containing protein isoform X3 [Pteropus medius]|uniref:B box and SPRY domain-containing protein isoform X3 n=1 Tax=Pteropus vampyrus TaxID=132908 RepID=A0A6P3Q4U3_PTEVA|nr:B box and SPRY domain-containing protein isoform X3 [Pteropus vampyrus]XP_039722800.1 B box and SPRY domain-containing protein isoform X3 [Pteropus giganteus]
MEAPPRSHLRQVERAAPGGRSAMSAESVGQGLGPRPGPGSGSESEPLCPEHGQALRWFCCSERRPVCAACAELGGRCQGHRIRPAQERAEELRSTASAVRELVIQRLGLVRSLCETEEQRLLERVHGEEERAHQSILTQRVHWAEALQKLDAIRTSLVDMLTHVDDLQLIQKEQEIFERTEEAEGILDPQESKKLNFNEKCARSPLLTQLWATAVFGSLSGTEDVRIDEKTVSPFLQLSDDRRTLTFNAKKSKSCADGPERFDHWPNALATTSFLAGMHVWMVNVQNSCAYKVGVALGQLPRKGSGSDSRLGHNTFSWVFSRYDQEFRFSHDGQHVPLGLLRCPAQLGVLLDLQAQELLFYEPASGMVLHTHRASFPGPLFPVFAVADQTISVVH